MGKVYNKLVRDKIPAIITEQGGVATTHVLDDTQYLRALIEKLNEECGEFTKAINIEELADVQEVVFALADAISSRTVLEETRATKAEERGTFAQKIFLEYTA